MNTEIRHRELMQPSAMMAFIRLMRPKQWSKNAFLFAPLLFAFHDVVPGDRYRIIVGFVLFCIVSSCVYVLNDYLDVEEDRNHPDKRHRPLAAGHLSPIAALAVGSVLFLSAIAYAFALSWPFGSILTAYFAMNVLYCFKLKHLVIVDIMVIALGFVLRAIGGGLIVGVRITPWFLLCIMLLALFLAIGKRRHEVLLLQQAPVGGQHRKVLSFYTIPLLDQMTNMVTSAIILSYCLFTFASDQTDYMMLTIPFVIYGMFRYLYLIHVEKKGGAPDVLLFEDRHILFTVIGYVLTAAIVLYVL